MNEAVDRVIEQREAMDRGFPMGVALSGVVHLMLAGAAFGAAWLGAREPRLRVADGIAVPMPRGGGGPVAPEPAPAAAPPVTTAAAPEPAPPAPAPPPRVLQPPKDEPRKGLPPPEAKRTKPPKPERSIAPPPRAAATPERSSASSHGTSGTGTTTSATPGLGIVGPAGPGSPTGSDAQGDWYLAGVQRKVWLIWTRQIKPTFSQQVTISFTILGDGSLEDGSVRLVQGSGLQLIDNAAERAVYSAGPFGPLPKTYGTNRITIQALFQPAP